MTPTAPSAPSDQPVVLPASVCAERARGLAPTLRRRMAAFVYEGVVLFGVVMMAGLVFGIATQQRHALHGREGLQACLFLVLALYFLWFWTHGGQTLAMKTWQVRLVSASGQPINLRQALTRFLASWLWFLPAWAGAWLAGWHQSRLLYGAILGWITVYALFSWLHPQRQFLHDALCGTRLIDNRP